MCLDFLKRDMLHIYRQVTALEGFRPVVLARKRENEARFPFDPKRIALLPRPRTRFLRRLWQKSIRQRPVQIYAGEVERMLEEVFRFDAAVVHVYFGHVAVQLLPFLRACPKPVVVSFHGADAGVDVGATAYRARMAEVLKRADLVLARSRALADDLVALGCPPDSVRVHRTGIPLDEYPFRERTVPPTGGAWRLLQACRLIEKKGVDTALRAFAGIAGEFPRATFTVAGDGPLRAALECEAAALGVADRVRFTGFVDPPSLRRHMGEAHLFVHPSRTGKDGNREGVPNALLEAMAAGLPVLTTRHGGIPEVVAADRSGILVDEEDVAGLTAGALRLMRDPGFHRSVAREARAVVERECERRGQARRLEEFYREAIRRRERGRRPW